METADLLKRVRKIEIKSRGLTNQIFSGQYHSAFKGRGMAFSEVREYNYGDDIRSIDWNVTARFDHPYVKVFEEERELTVMLLIDVSGSNYFGTQQMLKTEKITEIAAVLAFSAIQNNDKVGVVFFSDRIEKFIPPKKGTAHILRIIRELVTFKSQSCGTKLSEPLRFLTNAIKKRCTAFLITDFMDTGFQDAIKIASRKHDLIGIRIVDKRESELPRAGLMKIRDFESNQTYWVDTSGKEFQETHKYRWQQHEKMLHDIFVKSRIDVAKVNTDEDFTKPLIKLFKKRESRY
ncbi:MAG TPA: DUF58 domain-containing protein [Bacteroidales bacterium]|nr:DUF58 domain-containing protein [Bacteroidales bacterium]HNZ41942.1 DUF58 domain-containing protein [Bacteroidales bacterium]HOH83457.1 DUF58 domain-containing protein [Bacteroidales bacterium]HPB24257.1 DUF58 domain-containing protein [Bacteroidales bacterium]HPI28920.1 DUF58 domain-containing protein [Bacteroidales bacterium]